MSAARVFIDTNIFVYLYSSSSVDWTKRRRAHEALAQFDCQISTQVINEFCHVCTKKANIPTETLLNTISHICSYRDLSHIDEETIESALMLRAKYGYAYYDSLILASALEQDCTYLLSEDFADGQVIEGSMTIKNIFA